MFMNAIYSYNKQYHWIQEVREKVELKLSSPNRELFVFFCDDVIRL